jgi:hypothetical protein
MALFGKAELKVRVKEEVSFAGPFIFCVQVKGGGYGRIFWSTLPGQNALDHRDAYKIASDFAIKHKCRFVPS